eukprot:SM000192S04918  [mRNA]  locus=s192:261165:262753:- [translate_table: standard]
MWELQKGACTLLRPTVCTQGPDLVPFNISGADPRVFVDNCEYPLFIGGLCNPGVVNDPHFTGARGTGFDFNGVPGRSFCLLTDDRLHINMRLTGYLDGRSTVGASPLPNGKKAVRTWIRELGVLWTEEKAGVEHAARFVARAGKRQDRGDGYMARMEVDGRPLPRLQLGESAVVANGTAVVRLAGYEKSGPYDVDHYTFSVPGLLEADIRLRIAHPLLQSKDDAQTHLNVQLLDVRVSPRVHGVLGQTYRDDHAARALKYSALAELMGHNVAADGEDGAGFLDGAASDYEATAVLEPDCKFAQYQRPAAFTSGLQLPSTATN